MIYLSKGVNAKGDNSQQKNKNSVLNSISTLTTHE